MPKGKTKKFINKKNAVTFHLVHRSQQDPLAADETAPQRVLVPVNATQEKDVPEKSREDPKKRQEEQQKYGIFFDDDYDYLQHLRDVSSLPVEWQQVEEKSKDDKTETKEKKITLPSSVFASNVEEHVGLLNKAAPISGPQLDLDPDVVAAMDDDFDFDDPENQLEDNFLELANEGSDDEFDEDREYEYELNEEDEEYENSDVSSEGNMGDSDEKRDKVGSLKDRLKSFHEEETKSRFTEYSMSSSVMRRNEQLTLLDDTFEHMYAGYDDTEIGALECEEIEGFVPSNSDMLLQLAEEFEKKKTEDSENLASLMKDRMKIIERDCESSEDEANMERLVVEKRERDKWDCESILSTYSNIYNHPKLISEPKGSSKIRIDPRTGIPKDVLNGPSDKLTAKSLAQFDLQNDSLKPKTAQSIAETMKSTLSILSVRPKDEKPEERRERKKALKEYRKERRIEKKANSEAFKEEKKRQEKIILNNKQNVQGNRIV